MFVQHLGSARGAESDVRGSTIHPLTGGLGWRSVEWTRWRAFWANWANTVPLIRERHPEVAHLIGYHLEGGVTSPRMGSV